MDLSKNAFSGTIPQCLHKIYFGKIAATSFGYFQRNVSNTVQFMTPYTYKVFLKLTGDIYHDSEYEDAEVQIEFVTKYRHSSYKGSPLGYMSGLDFSCNNLTGGIPPELGQISSLHALNLSYNQLTGKIPITFSKMAQLESLDLSHNNLRGEIPSALIDLTFLEVFNVANNNLSGKVPDMKAQFGTFEKSSYEGNLFLCGPPLDKSCAKEKESDPTPTQSSNESDKKWYEVDPMEGNGNGMVEKFVKQGIAVEMFVKMSVKTENGNRMEDVCSRLYASSLGFFAILLYLLCICFAMRNVDKVIGAIILARLLPVSSKESIIAAIKITL
ncbi:receptor-like protein 14 [Juglans microcarpa x Juglans regia]|nr:receptor-like protein 14 [Juglans microcarpa x Juglans regia]